MADTSLVMIALGDFRFGLQTAAYQSLERETSWRWPDVEPIGGAPRPQFVGKGSDTIRLAGVIYPHFAGGLEQVDAMRAEADKGEPLRMVCGRGKIWGRWVIEGIREGQRRFWSNGAPRAQEFEVALKFYDAHGAMTQAGARAIPALEPQAVARLRWDENGALVSDTANV